MKTVDADGNVTLHVAGQSPKRNAIATALSCYGPPTGRHASCGS
jgi:hypothetical protein